MTEYLLACLFSLADKIEEKRRKLKEVLKEFKAKVLEEEKRDEELAYPIQKQTEAVLVKVFFATEPSSVLKLKEEIEKKVAPLRFLLVKYPYSKVKAQEKEEEKVKK